jgi:hypothetical protein
MGEASSDDPGLSKGADRQIRVLVAEDDPALQRMIINYLAENIIRVLAASGRQEMVRQIGMADVTVIVLDLRLGHALRASGHSDGARGGIRVRSCGGAGLSQQSSEAIDESLPRTDGSMSTRPWRCKGKRLRM